MILRLKEAELDTKHTLWGEGYKGYMTGSLAEPKSDGFTWGKERGTAP